MLACPAVRRPESQDDNDAFACLDLREYLAGLEKSWHRHDCPECGMLIACSKDNSQQDDWPQQDSGKFCSTMTFALLVLW